MMSISKLLVIGAVIAIIYFVFFKSKKPKNDQTDKKNDETMVECTKCSTFVTTKDAIIKNGKYFCSKECAQS